MTKAVRHRAGRAFMSIQAAMPRLHSAPQSPKDTDWTPSNRSWRAGSSASRSRL